MAGTTHIGKEFANLLSRVKTPVQLAGLVVIVGAAVIAKSSPSSALALTSLGALMLVFGQVFAHADKIPESSRASFVVWSLLLFVLAIGLDLMSGVANFWNAWKIQDRSPAYQASEQRLVDLKNGLDGIRTEYGSLLDRPDKATEVNKQARQLAERILAVDDRNLSLGIQIYKYEAAAYSWAMVAGSEADPNAKLKAVEDILKATEKGEELTEKTMRPGPYDKKIQDTRDWIVNDNAISRLQRLTAIALCTRWQIKKNPDDRLQVREIIHGLPYDYLKDEQPQTTSELRPCLVDNETNPQPFQH